MKKYNLLRTLALIGLCCAVITGAMAMDIYPPTPDEVGASLRLKKQWSEIPRGELMGTGGDLMDTGSLENFRTTYEWYPPPIVAVPALPVATGRWMAIYEGSLETAGERWKTHVCLEHDPTPGNVKPPDLPELWSERLGEPEATEWITYCPALKAYYGATYGEVEARTERYFGKVGDKTQCEIRYDVANQGYWHNCSPHHEECPASDDE